MSEIPNSAETLRQVTTLLERSDVAGALVLARDALGRGIEAPLLLNLRAYWLESESRPADALVDLRRAHELAPQDPMVLNALGLCLAKLGKFEEAVGAFRQCVELAPDFGPAHFNAGWTAEEIGEFDQAKASFEAAARLAAQTPDPWGRLAALAARRGQWQEARDAAAKALTIAPDNASATIALATADLAEKSFPAAKERLRKLIDTSGALLHDRATAVGLFGDVLDAEGRYHEAFGAYEGSNTLFKDLYAQQLALRPEMRMGDYVRWLLRSFDRPVLDPWPPAEASTFAGPDNRPARHIFLLGFPRSGTTLLEEVLACHPDIVTTGERDALGDVAGELLANPAQLENLRTLGPGRAGRYRARYFNSLAKFGLPLAGRILIDKQPFNTVRLPLIARLFPDARILFCLRDPRDVVLSCFRRRFAVNPANFEFLSLAGTAALYDTAMRLATIYRRVLPLEVHEIRNESLVADFEGEMRALCAFAGISWIDDFRDFASRTRARQVSTPSATQIQRGLGREGIGHWRHYRGEMETVLPILNSWAEKFGYETVTDVAPQNPPDRKP